MNKHKIPPYLKEGDTIGITCPAGPVVLDEMEAMFRQLEDWGFKVIVGKTVGSSFNKFSAPDEVRLAELQWMLNDSNINAILFGRGGYGLVRLIDRIDFSSFVQHPKWVAGFSDITCLLSHLHSCFNLPSIHAHMGGGYRKDTRDEESTQSIRNVLCGKPIRYHLPSHPLNREGTAGGLLVGGNLALLSDLIGTGSDLDTAGKILFIEDVGEYKYNIDRMLWQLKRAGKFENLAALLVGGFSDTLDNEVPFGMTEYEMVWEKVSEYPFPVYFDFPVGHQLKNWALKVGIEYDIEENLLLERTNFEMKMP